MLSSTFSLRVTSIIALLLAGCGMRSDMTTTDFGEGDSTTPLGGTSGTAGAAGGASASAIPSGGASAIPSGGVPTIFSGGATALASGGASMTASRSSSSLPSGGASAIAGSRASGGTSASSRTGGAGMPSGGTTVLASSGAGGSSRASVAIPPNCTGVICPALPKSCKKIVQDPSACCPVCTDTGCPECGDIKCGAGTHKETLPGDCCPTCVADPQDACRKGQKAYEELRKQLLDKYGTTKCQNSLDCTLLTETNACTAVCNVPLPTSYASSYRDNLDSAAKTNCATCPTLAPVMCERMVATCLNGKCSAANPS